MAEGETTVDDAHTADDVFARLRAAVATVADRATTVRIDHEALDRLAADLGPDDPPLLPEEVPAGDDDAMAAEVVAWNAVNFGSGWFPQLRKRPGLSGARSLAEALADHVAREGPPRAEWLAAADAAVCASVFGQPHPGPVDDLLGLFAQAWRDLGALLAERYDGSAAALVRAAGGSAATLVETLGSMPLAHDVATYGERASTVEVPFFKRAQITVSHLARAFDGQGLGRFEDVDRLTAFADNLVPHVLRMRAVLVYDRGLATRIDGGDLLRPGSPEEVEIRACAVHAVELLARTAGLAPAAVDHQLWQQGQSPEVKAVARHRCRCSWY
jgi:Potential Queuosine, Q, salvage protein family